jgi:hypothetical protein
MRRTPAPTLLANRPAPTRSQADLDERIRLLNALFDNDGQLGYAQSIRVIDAALHGLAAADIVALEARYQAQYGHALSQDLFGRVENPAMRFRIFQLLYPDRITSQAYPAAEQGDHAHIVMDQPVTEIMAGSTVDYGFNLGNVLYDPNRPPRIRSFVLNDPAIAGQNGAPPVVNGPDGRWENAHWTQPGVHTLVYEVQYGDQPPQYYTLQQTVVEPEKLAAQRLNAMPTPLNAELYLFTLQAMLADAKQQAGADEERLAQFRASVDNATKLLEGGATPLKAVLVTKEGSQAIPLTLFLKQTKDGDYAIIDLTNPHPDAARTYKGSTIEAAWQDFLRNNTLPAGQIAATPPEGAETTMAERWNAYSDGQSTLEQWSNGLGVLSLVALGAGVVLMFVPGGQIPGGYILGAFGLSAGAGALASGLSLADRAQYGNLTWNTQTQLELLDLAGSLLVGGALARAGRQLTTRSIGTLGVILEITETGTDVASALLLTKEYHDQIAAIQVDRRLSKLQKQEAIREVLKNAAQLGGLIVLGVGLSRVDFSRIRGAINLPDVPSGLRDAVNSSPKLQQILANANYDPAALQSLWHEWRRMQGKTSYRFFASWAEASVEALAETQRIRSDYNAQWQRGTPKMKEGQNIALADVELESPNLSYSGQAQQLLSVSGEKIYPSRFENRTILRPVSPNERIFDATEVGGYLRYYDTEYTILNRIAQDLGAQKNSVYTDVRGMIILFSDRPVCASCNSVIEQFQRMFPNVRVNILSGPDYSTR